MSVSNPDAITFAIERYSTSNYYVTHFWPFSPQGRIILGMGMPMPENIRFEKWYIFPQGNWDSGMRTDIVMSIGRNGAPLAVTTQVFKRSTKDHAARILDISALTFDRGDALSIVVQKTRAANPGSDRNNYLSYITGIWVRSS